MTSYRRSCYGQGAPHLDSSNYPSTSSSPSCQHSGSNNPVTSYHLHPQILEYQAFPTPSTTELTTLSLSATLCPLCKGNKYGFTAYFHNANIFPSPPHELLPLIEKSFVLKNRLKSLLVTYVMRELDCDGLREAEREVVLWNSLVEDLLGEVITFSTGVDLGLEPLDEVRLWMRSMVEQIRESLMDGRKLEMPKGRLDEILVRFRSLWEGVWRRWLMDRMNHGSGGENIQAGTVNVGNQISGGFCMGV